jgi:hypothetical protein
MPDNPITDSETESPYVDAENWQIAFEPYEGEPQAALTLAYQLAELKRSIASLNMHEAIAGIDQAIDSLYEHSDFRNVSRDLFLIAITGELTTDKEALLRQLGMEI